MKLTSRQRCRGSCGFLLLWGKTYCSIISRLQARLQGCEGIRIGAMACLYRAWAEKFPIVDIMDRPQKCFPEPFLYNLCSLLVCPTQQEVAGLIELYYPI